MNYSDLNEDEKHALAFLKNKEGQYFFLSATSGEPWHMPGVFGLERRNLISLYTEPGTPDISLIHSFEFSELGAKFAKIAQKEMALDRIKTKCLSIEWSLKEINELCEVFEEESE